MSDDGHTNKGTSSIGIDEFSNCDAVTRRDATTVTGHTSNHNILQYLKLKQLQRNRTSTLLYNPGRWTFIYIYNKSTLRLNLESVYGVCLGRDSKDRISSSWDAFCTLYSCGLGRNRACEVGGDVWTCTGFGWRVRGCVCNVHGIRRIKALSKQHDDAKKSQNSKSSSGLLTSCKTSWAAIALSTFFFDVSWISPPTNSSSRIK